jgi:hypothetical protein
MCPPYSKYSRVATAVTWIPWLAMGAVAEVSVIRTIVVYAKPYIVTIGKVTATA